MGNAIRIDLIPCCDCQKDLSTKWLVNDDGTNNGMLSSVDFALYGDAILCRECSRKMEADLV